jgi:Domain of unknown function (DUF4124)
MASLNLRLTPVATSLFACCATLALSSAAQAQLYRWTDENGKVHYSDTIPPSAVDRARKEIRSDGIVKSQVERALTPEERRAAALKAAEDEKVRIAKEERERRDKALLMTYATLADFDRVRDRALATLDSDLTALTNRLYTLNAQRTALKKDIGIAGAKTPIKLTRELEELESQIEEGTAFQSKRIRERVQMVATYAQERVRLADLIAAEAALNKPATATPTQAPAAAKKKS